VGAKALFRSDIGSEFLGETKFLFTLGTRGGEAFAVRRSSNRGRGEGCLSGRSSKEKQGLHLLESHAPIPVKKTPRTLSRGEY